MRSPTLVLLHDTAGIIDTGSWRVHKKEEWRRWQKEKKKKGDVTFWLEWQNTSTVALCFLPILRDQATIKLHYNHLLVLELQQLKSKTSSNSFENFSLLGWQDVVEILVRVVSSYFLTEISVTVMRRHVAEADLIWAGDVKWISGLTPFHWCSKTIDWNPPWIVLRTHSIFLLFS